MDLYITINITVAQGVLTVVTHVRVKFLFILPEITKLEAGSGMPSLRLNSAVNVGSQN
jgi:hypothetical protein